MNRRRGGGLGSGLDALMPASASGSVREVPVERLRQNPRQPRTHFDEAALEDLAASIREHGVIQPIIVSERADGGYEIVAGERRWRAAQRAGLAQVPVVVREATPQGLLELALIENVQRADLNPLEEAQAYQNLKDDFGLSDSQIAQRVGKNNRVTVTNTRRLLNLPAPVQEAILRDQISAGHGRALLKLETAEQQLAALDLLLSEDLSVREAERLGDLVRETGDLTLALAQARPRAEAAPPKSKAAARARAAAPRQGETSDDDRQIRRELERLLQTPVGIARHAGELRVTIAFHTDEKLQEFFDALNNVYS